MGESRRERGGLKDFLCGVVMLDEMMDDLMMTGAEDGDATRSPAEKKV